MRPRSRLLIAVVALVAGAAILQTTLIARLGWPGGIGPDVLLLAVVAVALATSPNYGAVTGFSAGLLADILPPDITTVGTTAFVLALVGYLAGGVRDPRGLALVQLFGLIAGLALLAGALHLALSLILADRAPGLAEGFGSVLGSTLITAGLGLLIVPPMAALLLRVDRGSLQSTSPASRATVGSRHRVRYE